MNDPLYMPKGSVRAIAFVLIVLAWVSMVAMMAHGCVYGNLTFEQFMKFVQIVVLPTVSLAMGFYFGQKVVKKGE